VVVAEVGDGEPEEEAELFEHAAPSRRAAKATPITPRRVSNRLGIFVSVRYLPWTCPK